MTIIQLNIPSNCSQYGLFVESDNYWDLSQDMIDIQSTNGALVSVGWCPDYDPTGSYVISVSRGMTDLALSVTTKDAREAADCANRFIEEYL